MPTLTQLYMFRELRQRAPRHNTKRGSRLYIVLGGTSYNPCHQQLELRLVGGNSRRSTQESRLKGEVRGTLCRLDADTMN